MNPSGLRGEPAFDARYMEHACFYAAQPFWFYEVGQLIAAVRRQLQGGRVLDFGCNDGALAAILHHYARAAAVSGLDVNEAAVIRGWHAWPELDLVGVQDGQPFPYRDADFDVVLSLNTLGHVADPNHALREMHRVLAPAGRLALVVPNHRYYQARDLLLPGPPGDATQRWQFRRANLGDLVEAAGFDVDRVSLFGRHPPLMPWLRSRILLEGHRP